MPQRPQSPAFKLFVLLVSTSWLGVLVAALWRLDWRWIPTTLVAVLVLLLLGGMVENHLHERAEMRELARQLDEAKGKPRQWGMWLPRDEDREAHRAAIAAEEEAWLGGQEQPR
jgi:hypothetical protein